MVVDFLVQIFKVRDLRKKVLFVLFIFAIFRFLANIPIPGINEAQLKRTFEQYKTLGLLNLFTGGTLERFSIVMLGVGPYIIAIVILQLLTMIFPSLEKMYKEGGEEGRRKFEQYGRILTVPLAALQAFGMLMLFRAEKIIDQWDPLLMISSIFTITAGTIFLMWLGELISEKGIGEGISLLIFAGIAADFPRNILALATGFEAAQILSYFLFFLLAIFIIYFVVSVTLARRHIPISYAKRVRGFRLYGGVQTTLPLPVNPAGVMPIIFALSILTFPSMIAQFLKGAGGILGQFSQILISFFENLLIHGILYFIFVFLFAFFYTMVVFDPKSVAENLQKMGGFIPGLRPGKATAEYLSYVLYRVLFFGALFLGLIAISPSLIQAFTKVGAFSFLVGGTSVLILVSVALDTFERLKSELEMREYESF